MQEICVLSFVIEPLSDDNPVRSIVPVVNGIQLTALIGDFERVGLYEPSGGYAGLVPEFSISVLLTTISWVSVKIRFLRNVITCSVVNAEKWVAGHWRLGYSLLGDRSRGRIFKQPFRSERDYSTFGPFRFDLEQYRRTVTELASTFRIE